MWFCFGIQKFQDDPKCYISKNIKGLFQYQQVLVKTQKGTFQVSTSLDQDPSPKKNTRDSSVISQSQSIWQSEEAPSNQETKNYKKLQERKIYKNKSKRNLLPPEPREDPKKERSPSRHDATRPQERKRSWSSSATEEKRRWASWLCTTIVTEETSQEKANPRVQFSLQECPCLLLLPRKSEDQPELFSDF